MRDREPRLLLIGRVLFGVAMVGFGVLCLAYVDFVHQLQPVDQFLPASTSGYGVVAVLTGVVLIAAGLAVVAKVRTRAAAVALAALFALGIVLLQVPSAFDDPALLRSPWWVRTFESLALAGAALIVAGLAADPARASWVRAGRVAFGLSLPVFGVLHFVYAENVASLVPDMYPWPLFWAYLTGTGHLAAGVAIATGVLSRLAATLAGAMFGIWVLTLHLPSMVESARPDQTSLFVAIGMWGAAWIVAGSLATRDAAAAAEGPASLEDEARPLAAR